MHPQSLFFVVACLYIACASPQPPHTTEDFAVIPQVKSLTPLAGSFHLNTTTELSASPEFASELPYLEFVLREGLATRLVSKNNVEEKNRINILFDPTIAHKEGYELEVLPEKITIQASAPAGAFYGLQTLRQLILTADTSGASLPFIPACKITDSPRFTYRGMHLDVSRHFFTVDEVKTYIDILAMHKLNQFHWHLTDDQGWRIEIKKYPLLTEIGSLRSGTAIGLAGTRNPPYTYDQVPYGGYYTQDQIREVVAFAKTRHVTIIPEIELPGHASAALAAYPEFGNHTGPYEVAKHWGIFSETFSPTEKTFTFLEEVLTEVIALFPGKYIHIGGDEVLKEEWSNSTYAQSLMEREGLQNEDELQSYFVQRIGRFLSSKGRRMVGWDEILEGGLAPDATVMSWRGTEGGIEAAKQGHDVIMTPGTHLYFDYYQADSSLRAHEPITGSTRHTTLEKVYRYEPIPDELSAEQANHILGAQANVWTEYMPNFKQVQYKSLPRMTALSEVVWSPKASRDSADFHRRLQAMARRYDVLGYNYARYSID